MKNSVLLVLVLRHVRGYFLHMYAYKSFLLTLYTNIFILDSDQFLFLLSTNLLFGLFGPGSIPALGPSQIWSLQVFIVGCVWNVKSQFQPNRVFWRLELTTIMSHELTACQTEGFVLQCNSWRDPSAPLHASHVCHFW